MTYRRFSIQNVHVINSKERDAEVYVIAYCIDDKVKKAEDLLDPKLLTGRVEENINDGDDLTLGSGGILCYSKKENDVPSFLSWAIAVYESDQGPRGSRDFVMGSMYWVRGTKGRSCIPPHFCLQTK